VLWKVSIILHTKKKKNSFISLTQNLENNHGITPTVVLNTNTPWKFDQHAPWTKLAKMSNDVASAGKKKIQPVIIPPLKDWFYFRGDKVSTRFYFSY
jgi:hypothetical protein